VYARACVLLWFHPFECGLNHSASVVRSAVWPAFFWFAPTTFAGCFLGRSSVSVLRVTCEQCLAPYAASSSRRGFPFRVFRRPSSPILDILVAPPRTVQSPTSPTRRSFVSIGGPLLAVRSFFPLWDLLLPPLSPSPSQESMYAWFHCQIWLCFRRLLSILHFIHTACYIFLILLSSLPSPFCIRKAFCSLGCLRARAFSTRREAFRRAKSPGTRLGLRFHYSDQRYGCSGFFFFPPPF